MYERLLSIANTDTGKYLLGIDSGLPIVGVTKNGWVYQLEEDVYIAEFRCYDVVIKYLYPLLAQMEIANEYSEEAIEHFAGLHRKPHKYPTIYLATDTFYATASGDGYVLNQGSTYSTVRGAATGSSVGTADTKASWFGLANSLSGGTYYVGRSFYPFDTSSLPNSAEISAAVFSAFKDNTNTVRNDDSDSVSLIQTSQASATTLSTADFDAVGTTKGASDIALSSVTENAYNNFTLNATGLSWIQVAGATLLGLRMAKDIGNNTPTGNNDGGNNAGFTYSDRSGTNEDPKLVITYTVPSGGNPMFFGGGVTVG